MKEVLLTSQAARGSRKGLVRNGCAKGGSQPFLLGPLHKHYAQKEK